MAPLLLLRWLVSFFNIEFCLTDRTLRLSLVKLKFGEDAEDMNLRATNGAQP